LGSRTTAPVQTVRTRLTTRLAAGLDALRAAEQEQLPLWLPVLMGAGITLWFALPWAPWRLAAAMVLAALAGGALLMGARLAGVAALVLLAGMGAVELRVAGNGHAVLAERQFTVLVGRVTSVEPRAFGAQRLVLAPDAGIGASAVPLGRVMVLALPQEGGVLADARLWLERARTTLARRIMARLPGETGALAAAFVTGQQGAIPPVTAQAMRDAGLAHLLSISGLHIAVVVGGTALLARLVLAAWPWLALRVPVPTVALGLGALAGLAYCLLAGAQVPTVRAVVAATIVVIGLMLGRQALSLRLLGAGAMAIMAVRPEALLGASFQMSFAAVAAIIALGNSRLGRWISTRGEDEPLLRRLVRAVVGLIATGLVAELALAGIGLHHFGQAGLYGVIANLLAIPLTSFLVMPALGLALLGETLGTGIMWPLAGGAMGLLVAIADTTAAMPGATLRVMALPAPAYALGAAGGVWLVLWATWLRWAGLVPLAGAALWAHAAVPPDLLISADGRQLAVLTDDGTLAYARQRVGAYLHDNWTEATGARGDARWLGDVPAARCSPDLCIADLARGGRRWRVMATTSRMLLPRADFARACAGVDIIVSDRRLPAWCAPRWLKLDAASLATTGAVAIHLASRRIVTAADAAGDRAWQTRRGQAPRRQQGHDKRRASP
jgi:competence protein ComEC